MVNGGGGGGKSSAVSGGAGGGGRWEARASQSNLLASPDARPPHQPASHRLTIVDPSGIASRANFVIVNFYSIKVNFLKVNFKRNFEKVSFYTRQVTT